MELDLHVVLKIMDNVKTHLVVKNKTRISQTRCAEMSIYGKPQNAVFDWQEGNGWTCHKEI